MINIPIPGFRDLHLKFVVIDFNGTPAVDGELLPGVIERLGEFAAAVELHVVTADNVTIYPNSTILGGETVIGESSMIGADVFFMHSVPANSLVIYEETGLQILNKQSKKKKTLVPEFSI